ncbi:MAG: LysM peptidoglycan-binding domain-containing protein [Acidobacteriota bacterium]
MSRIRESIQSTNYQSLSNSNDNSASVRLGESSLSQIAERLGLSQEALRTANPQIADPDNLKVGQEILLPTQEQNQVSINRLSIRASASEIRSKSTEKSLQSQLLEAKIRTTGFASETQKGGFNNLAAYSGALTAESLSGSATTNPRQSAEAQIKQDFAERFSRLASNKSEFDAMMKEVYGANYDPAMAESFRQRALKGDFSWLPKIEFTSDETLQGANGAYDSSSNVVYINEKFINDTSMASQIYLEETGHFLDAKLNKTDTTGDEGEMFRRLMMGEQLSSTDKAAIREENDLGTINVNGKEVTVEFWNPFKAIKKAAKAVGGAIADGAKAVGGAIAKGAKEVGKTISHTVKAVGGLVDGALEAVRGSILNTFEGIKTFGSGIGKIFTGKFGEGFKDLGLGLVKTFVQTPVDSILMVGGRAISGIQTIFRLEPPGRKLTGPEIAALRQVYGDSIDYSKVVIKEGNAGLFSLTGRAFTHGNTIYIPKKSLPLTQQLLTHEMAHVWQNQNGGTDYMSEALWGQYLGDGYDFEKGIKEGKSWSQLNPEQQAELLEQAFANGFFNAPGNRFFYNGTDYTDYLNDALRQVRSGKGAP